MTKSFINAGGIDREMTEAEFAEYQATTSDMIQKENELNALKTSARTKLLALGLTEEELTIIAGI